MPPLYPKMRERPMEFRINYDAPLAEGLVFAGLGGHGCVGSMVYPDSSLYGNHGTLTDMDAATNWVWDDKLSAWSTRHNNGYVLLSQAAHTGSDSFTVSCWINSDSVQNRYAGIVSSWPIQSSSRQWMVEKYSTQCGITVNNNAVTARFSWSLVSSGWHNIIGRATLDRSALEAFADGILQAQNLSYTGAGAPSSQTSIGTNIGYTPYLFKGLISSVLIYNRSITDPEISALADPSNVDLRVGGVPLILPPRRRFWPVVSEQAVPKMVPWHLFQQVGA